MKINKRHERYFRKTENLKNIGITMLAIGGVIFFVGRGVVLYFNLVGVLPLGFVIFLMGTVGRSTDMEINSVIKIKTDGMEIDLQNNERVAKSLIRAIEPLTVLGYEYRDGLPIKKAKNNELRTPEYCQAILYPLADCLYVVRVRIDLLTEREQKDVLEIPYERITNLFLNTETVDVSMGKKIYAIKASHLTIETEDGEGLRFPMRESALIDNFVNDVMRHMDGKI